MDDDEKWIVSVKEVGRGFTKQRVVTRSFAVGDPESNAAGARDFERINARIRAATFEAQREQCVAIAHAILEGAAIEMPAQPSLHDLYSLESRLEALGHAHDSELGIAARVLIAAQWSRSPRPADALKGAFQLGIAKTEGYFYQQAKLAGGHGKEKAAKRDEHRGYTKALDLLRRLLDQGPLSEAAAWRAMKREADGGDSAAAFLTFDGIGKDEKLYAQTGNENEAPWCCPRTSFYRRLFVPARDSAQRG